MNASMTDISNDTNENSDSIAYIEENADICIDDFLSKSRDYCGEWVGATLKKLPLSGIYNVPIENGVYFEWPTED